MGCFSICGILRVDRLHTDVNVEKQKDNIGSLLTLHRRLLELREKEVAFTAGDFVPVYADNQLLSFVRELEGHPRFLMVLNLSHRPCYFKSVSQDYTGTIEVSTVPELEGNAVGGVIVLEADQGIVVRLD